LQATTARRRRARETPRVARRRRAGATPTAATEANTLHQQIIPMSWSEVYP
jgi:hypothetical protein